MRNTNTARQYLANPFSPLYNSADFTISDADWIEQLLEQVLDIERSLHCEEELGYIVNQIKFLQLSFVRQGLYYWCIKHRKLYKQTHSNFAQFCREVLGRNQWQIDDCINAARVVLILITRGFAHLPSNIAQCSVLATLPDEDAIAQGWQKVLDLYKPHEITAAIIKLVLYPPEPVPVEHNTSIRLEQQVYEQIVLEAFKRRCTVSEFVAQAIQHYKILENFWFCQFLFNTA